jgi:hypothetical protein
MKSEQESTAELILLNPIRVETALSRYPVHRLAKHGDVTIDIRDMSGDGETLIRWDVSHNSKYGQPGPLAYKLDTLIINRRLEEACRPVPRVIRLGSLNDICRELGSVESGKNTNHIKIALHQNASAYITAKTRYRQSNGTERSIEFGDTRYAVVFTGERLPDGRVADAVYIVLHDFYREILDNAITRPLDYGYLRELTPAPQRFYELLSYQMYAALKHDRARAKLVYSEFCTHAPQTRYMEFDGVKKQMHKIHSVHRKSGYIAKIDYEQTTDGDGKPDWIMFYMPGPKARAEFRTFTKRGATTLDIEPSSPRPAIAAPAPTQLDLGLPKKRKTRRPSPQRPEPSPLVAELVRRGVTEERAVELVQLYPERIETQIDILDGLPKKKLEKIDDPSAWLVAAIKANNTAPKGHVTKAEREKQAEAARQRHQTEAEHRRRQQQQDATERQEQKQATAYWDSLTPEQQAEVQAKADAQADPADLAQQTGPLKSFGQTIRRQAYIRQLLKNRQPEDA